LRAVECEPSAALMGFFKNKAFNLMYWHAALQAIAAYGGESFVFVYLLKAGIPAYQVLLCIGLLFGSRVFLRKAVLPTVKAFGLQRTLVFGIVLEGLTYPLLSQATSMGPLLWSYLGLLAISSSFYWTTYHAYVALLGDNENRGAQVSAMEFIATFIGIVAPVMSGVLLTYFNPLVAFSVVGLAMACSAIPILLMPHLDIADEVEMPVHARRQAFWLMFTDGLRSGSFHFTWLIAMFITLGGSFVAYGGAMSFAGIVGAIAGLFLGKSIDLGKGKRAAQVGFSVLAAAITARMLGSSMVWSAIVANAVASVAWPIYITSFNSRVYQLARQSNCPLRYHVTAEGGWDTGLLVSCSVASALVYLGFSFFWPLSIALIGCGLGYILLAKTFDEVAD
jgi:DHA1 family inner membrane transport protein